MTNKINETICTRLAALMVHRGVEGTQMAEAIGSSGDRLRRILGNKTAIKGHELVLAAQKLGVTVAVLVGEAEFKPEAGGK